MVDIQLSPSQNRARQAVRSWLSSWRYGSSKPFFYLAGYAGCGKTTIARVLPGDVRGAVVFASYTGKAADVMRRKGCHGARTIHSLIYQYEDDDETGSPTFGLNEDSEAADAGLIVIDECSMVDESVGRDLLSFRRPILVLGDPAQLPPVGGAGFFTKGEPDIMLTEIRRQELESPILRLATAVRSGELIKEQNNDERCVVMRRRDADGDIWMRHDQMIVGKNETRNLINRRIRERLGYVGWVPNPTERLICLRNNRENGLFNGQMWDVKKAHFNGSRLYLDIINDEANVHTFAHAKLFQGEKLENWERRDADEFDYAYAITCHKSQGSEWDSVLAFDESGCFKEQRQAWLYTVITRAAERLTVLV